MHILGSVASGLAIASVIWGAVLWAFKQHMKNEGDRRYQLKDVAPSESCELVFVKKETDIERHKAIQYRFDRLEETANETKKMLYDFFYKQPK